MTNRADVKRWGVGRGMNSMPPRRKPSKLATLGLMQVMAKTRPNPAYRDLYQGTDVGPMSADLAKSFGPCQDRGPFTDWSEHPKED